MGYTLAELGALTSAQIKGNPKKTITGVNTLDEAESTDVSFLENTRYQRAMRRSKAGVVCVGTDTALPEGKDYLISNNPTLTFQKIVKHLLRISQKSGFQNIHPSAVIHPEAQVAEGVTIGPNTVIDQGAKIGPNTQVGPNVSIGFGVEVGADCQIHPNCTIREKCVLGDRVILQPGVVIGSCGYGYTPDQYGRHTKLEQLGNVILEEDVEIGANTTVDRSRFKSTIIRKGTKIDNLVQVAHNVEIGEHNIIAAQTGIAGSAKTGNHVMLGGQVGVVGHVEIDSQVLVATRGGVR